MRAAIVSVGSLNASLSLLNHIPHVKLKQWQRERLTELFNCQKIQFLDHSESLEHLNKSVCGKVAVSAL